MLLEESHKAGLSSQDKIQMLLKDREDLKTEHTNLIKRIEEMHAELEQANKKLAECKSSSKE